MIIHSYNNVVINATPVIGETYILLCKSFYWIHFSLLVFEGPPPPPGQLCPGEDSKLIYNNCTSLQLTVVASIVTKGAFIRDEVLVGGRKSGGLMDMPLLQRDLL